MGHPVNESYYFIVVNRCHNTDELSSRFSWDTST